jgi:diguanylate cyclase (GGDEF)-like protein
MRALLYKYAELDLDAVFVKFYDTMLSNNDFSGFFRDSEQIKSLVVRQKQFLLESINVPDEELKARYVKLGELHYDLKLPYVDYMAGINILQEGMTLAIVEFNQPLELLAATSNFFKMIRAFAAKGYLNRMLRADMQDIDLYLSQVQRAAEVDTSLSTERMIWLKNIIFAIKEEDRTAAPALVLPEEVLDTIKVATRGDQMLMNYVLDIAGRMEVDARNIFYFLDRHSYEEVLPLYSELMSIYKLSLMLTNVVTIASANLLLETLSKDALTGMLTRHALAQVFQRELTFAAVGQYEISLIMIDIDHFKLVNDTYGHVAGDTVLARVAHVVADTIRATDFAFRMGGEEFLLVLKGASLKVALAQAEMMRKEVEQIAFNFNGAAVSVTASFGVATFVAPFSADLEKMIELADAKLYESKHNGRNRVSH